MPRSAQNIKTVSSAGAPALGAADDSTVTAVPASTSSVVLQAANNDRYSLFIFNNSSANLYVKFGTGASISSFTAVVPANTLFDMVSPVPYTGAVEGVWDTATGEALVTEVF